MKSAVLYFELFNEEHFNLMWYTFQENVCCAPTEFNGQKGHIFLKGPVPLVRVGPCGSVSPNISRFSPPNIKLRHYLGHSLLVAPSRKLDVEWSESSNWKCQARFTRFRDCFVSVVMNLGCGFELNIEKLKVF